MLLTTCPRCREPFRMPAGQFAPDARARCPWCREQFPLSEVLKRLPPPLEILTPDGEPIQAPVEGDHWDDPTFASGLELVDSDEVEAFAPFGGETAEEGSSDEPTPQDPPSSSLFVLDKSEADATVENFDPFASESSNRGGDDFPTPMRVQPNADVTLRHKPRRSSALRTLLGIALGPLIALPLAGAILVAVNRAPDLGFYPFDGSFGPRSSRTAAPPSPSQNSGRPDSAAMSPQGTAPQTRQPWTKTPRSPDASDGAGPPTSPKNDPRKPRGRSLADGLDDDNRDQDAGISASDPAANDALEQIAGDRFRELQSGEPQFGTDKSTSTDESIVDPTPGTSAEIDLPDEIDPTSASDPTAEINLNDPPSIVAPRTVVQFGDASPGDSEGSDPRFDAGLVDNETRRPDSPEIASSDDSEMPERNDSSSESDISTEVQSDMSADSQNARVSDTPADANERIDADPSATVRTSEFRSAVEDAAERLSSLASVDRTDPSGRRSMALAYRAVARVASLAGPGDHDEMSGLIARVRDSGQLETFGRVAPEWFRVPAAKRGSDGILLVGEMRRNGNGWVIQAGEDATVDVIAPADRGLAEVGYETLGGDETATGSRGIFLGRIVAGGDAPAIELLSAEPL